MKKARIRVFFDGGCRPNPGPVEVAAVVRGAAYIDGACGHGSNSDAEWLALLHAARVCRAQGLRDVELVGDALEIVRQANRALDDGTIAHPLAAQFIAIAPQIAPVKVRWIKRSHNLAGIALAARHPR